MFYMPGRKMLFGDAKDSCEGGFFSLVYVVVDYSWADRSLTLAAIKRGLEARA